MIFFIFITFLEIYWFHKENQIFIKFNMIYLETITYWKTKLKFSIDSQSEHDLDFWTLVHDMTDGGKCWGKLGGDGKHYYTSRQKILGFIPELHLNTIHTTISVERWYDVCFVALIERKLVGFFKVVWRNKISWML